MKNVDGLSQRRSVNCTQATIFPFYDHGGHQSSIMTSFPSGSRWGFTVLDLGTPVGTANYSELAYLSFLL